MLRAHRQRPRGERAAREAAQRYLALLGALGRLRAEVDETALAFAAGGRWPRRPTSRRTSARCTDARQAGAAVASSTILRSQAAQREQELAELADPARPAGALARAGARGARDHRAARRPAGWSPRSSCCACSARSTISQASSRRPASPCRGSRRRLREANRRIEERDLSFRAEAQRELNAVQAEAAALGEAITADGRPWSSGPRCARRCAAPIKQLFVNTVGGVIQPGADLVEIVPLEDKLLVEAKVRPADIAFLRPGQPADGQGHRLRLLDLRRAGRRGRGHQRRHHHRRARRELLSGARADPTTTPCTRPASPCRSFPA